MKNYTFLDQQTQELFLRIRRQINSLQNWAYDEGRKNMNIRSSNYNGASYLFLKELAAKYKQEENLALMLWNTGKREEQIIASFLLPPELIKEKITQLFQECTDYEVAEYFGSIYLSGRNDIRTIVHEWSDSISPFLQTAAISGIARHLILNKATPLISREEFESILNKPYTDNYVLLVKNRHFPNN